MLAFRREVVPQPTPVNKRTWVTKEPKSVFANFKNPLAKSNKAPTNSFDITLLAKSWKVAFTC